MAMPSRKPFAGIALPYLPVQLWNGPNLETHMVFLRDPWRTERGASPCLEELG